ncbi:hypothetical protein L1887_08783 [Cichorium endivia]|nr:hypothetical protein L1887_08783 [Cichorium endivia]
MDIDPPVPPSSAPKKKPKFTPKAPARRKTGPVLPKNDDDAEVDPELLRKLHERHGTRKPKVEKKSSSNVTTSHGAGSSSTPLKPEDESSKNSPNFRESAQKNIIIPNSIGKKDGHIDKMLIDDAIKSSRKTKKKYKERWDPHSYYPISLPWRPLGSGDPEILNEQEFEEEKDYNENKINSASELRLLEKDDEKRMILFKFPQKLPLDKQTKPVPVNAKGKEKVNSSSFKERDPSNRSSDLNELPNGHVGKMLVYKSGAIKFKLGDVLFDVSSGILDECAQNVALMNTKTKDCFVLGQVDKQAVIVPDLDSILDNINGQ